MACLPVRQDAPVTTRSVEPYGPSASETSRPHACETSWPCTHRPSDSSAIPLTAAPQRGRQMSQAGAPPSEGRTSADSSRSSHSKMQSAVPASGVPPSQRGAGRASQGEWAHDLYKDKEPVMEPVAREQQGPPPVQGSSYTGEEAGLCTVARLQECCTTFAWKLASETAWVQELAAAGFVKGELGDFDHQQASESAPGSSSWQGTL